MKFQDRLLNIINTYIENNTLPHSILLEGDKGCGKKTLCEYVAKSLGIDFIDLTDTITLETLEEIHLSVSTKLYYINGQQISIKEQNAILKFLEEPLTTAYIFICTENKTLLLPTIVNRCVSITFDRYSRENLSAFLEGPSIILDYAQTPGQVKEFEKHKIEDMVMFAKKVLTQISVANYSNIMKISNNIDFTSNNSELFDFDIFTFILIKVALLLYQEEKISYDMFQTVGTFYRECNIPRINKAHLFENFVIKYKRCTDN